MTAGSFMSLAITLSLAVPTSLLAQSTDSEPSRRALSAHVPTVLRDAANRAGSPLATATPVRRVQAPRQQRKSNAIAWGAGVGLAAGVGAGLAQPTHSNGEYVLGSSRAMSALALGAAGLGVGAVVGLLVDKLRN
jgi:hypothetical protein